MSVRQLVRSVDLMFSPNCLYRTSSRHQRSSLEVLAAARARHIGQGQDHVPVAGESRPARLKQLRQSRGTAGSRLSGLLRYFGHPRAHTRAPRSRVSRNLYASAEEDHERCLGAAVPLNQREEGSVWADVAVGKSSSGWPSSGIQADFSVESESALS